MVKLLLFVVAGLATLVCLNLEAGGQYVWYEKSYDTEYGVVCYKTAGGSLSCVKAIALDTNRLP